MASGRWITPDVIPSTIRCRTLEIPDDPYIVAVINGLLYPLMYADNWEQVGAVTPSQMADAMRVMFDDYLESECGAVLGLDVFHHEEATNTNGGGITANIDTKIPFTQGINYNDGLVTLGSNIFTVPEGRWLVEGHHAIRAGANYGVVSWLHNESTDTIHTESIHLTSLASVNDVLLLKTILNLTGNTNFSWKCRATQTTATNFFGVARNVSPHDEVYGAISFLRLGEHS